MALAAYQHLMAEAPLADQYDWTMLRAEVTIRHMLALLEAPTDHHVMMTMVTIRGKFGSISPDGYFRAGSQENPGEHLAPGT